MKSLFIAWSSALFVATLLWIQAPDADGFPPPGRAIIKALSPLPDLPVDTTNKYRDSPSAALLGQKLFFERASLLPSGLHGPRPHLAVLCRL